MKTTVRAAICAAVLVTAGFTAASPGQKTGPVTPPLVIDSMYGPDLYRSYCATCHGFDGKGHGPVASALKVRPPDLTMLARRHNGGFPAREVEAIIRGGASIGSHGSDDMPVWGSIFYALDPTDARVKARVAVLVAHIASIQQR
jgi:hypothetical protein